MLLRTAVLGVGVPSMIEAIMQGVVLNNDREKDKKKREENVYKSMASASFSYLSNTIPNLGLASYTFDKAIGMKNKNYDLSPVEGALSNMVGIIPSWVEYAFSKRDAEADRKLVDSMGKAAAVMAPYPNVLNTWALNIWDTFAKGGDFTLADIVTRRRNQK
jgi:hypothetical protein